MNHVFGKKIKKLRKDLNLTIDDVAKKIKISKGYLSEIENGKKRPPSDKMIRKFCKIFKIDKKILLRLAHIDKISDDIKQELYISKIITPSKYLKEKGKELSSILEESYKGNRKTNISEDYIPIINNYKKIDGNFDEYLKNVKDYVRFKLDKVNISFALQIHDDSMERKTSISFKKGDIVFFSKIERIHKNDFVFVVYQSDVEITQTFQQVTESNRGKIHLKSLSPKRRKELVVSRKDIVGIWKAVNRLDTL